MSRAFFTKAGLALACALGCLALPAGASATAPESALAVDPALPSQCAGALSARIAAAWCDPARAGASRSVRLKANGHRRTRAALRGRPIRPGKPVVLTAPRPRKGAHLMLLYRGRKNVEYVRFSRLPHGRRLRAVIVSRRSHGRVVVRMKVGRRYLKPVVRRPWVAPEPQKKSSERYRGPKATPEGGGGCARPDEAYDRQWTRFGPGWTGGDGSFSVALPDGRTVWLFGDSYLGTVDPDRARPLDSPMVRNAFVVQDGSTLATLHGGSASAPSAFVKPEDSEAWYWPGDGMAAGGKLQVLMGRYKQTSPDMWGFTYVGTDLATFSLPDLRLESLTPRTSTGGGSNVNWGGSVFTEGAYTYVYGIERRGWDTFGYVARAPAGRLQDPWEYFNGSSWSGDPSAASPIVTGVSDQFTVLRVRDRYVIVSQAPVFGREVLAFNAASPAGPFDGRTVVYETPKWGPNGFTYNAVAHPELSEGGDLLVSYSTGSHDPRDAFSDADHYRPRFLRVPEHCLGLS